MWEAITHVLSEWFKGRTVLANIGMTLGLLLFIMGVLWKNSRYRWMGLVVVGLSLIAGIVQFIYG